jgi:hypothetical protein
MYLVGLKSDKQLLYRSSTYSSNEPSDQIILENIIEKYGGTAADYSIYRINDATIATKRIQNGDEFNLVWDNDIISGVDFTIEDSKPWIKFYTEDGKSEILANNMDTAVLIMEMWKADKSGIDITFNSIIRFTITTPRGPAIIKCQFVNGICKKQIKTEVFGDWIFPGNLRHVNGYRIFNSQKIIVLLPFV